MTKKEIKDLAKELLSQMNTTPLEMDAAIDDKTLDILSAKITARFISLKELSMWHDRLHNLTQVDWDYINMSEEEDYVGVHIHKIRFQYKNGTPTIGKEPAKLNYNIGTGNYETYIPRVKEDIFGESSEDARQDNNTQRKIF